MNHWLIEIPMEVEFDRWYTLCRCSSAEEVVGALLPLLKLGERARVQYRLTLVRDSPPLPQ